MLSIIMLHYGDDQMPMAQQALAAIREHTVGEHEIVFWRNGDYAYERGTKHRLGLAEAYNLAAAEATGDMLCFVHNDCFVTPGWNLPLEAVALEGDIAFPTVETNKEIASARGVPPVPDWMPPSCCFVFERTLWDELGGFDEIYEGCHFEDMDLFFRATKLGARLRQCSSTVMHVRGVTRAAYAEECNDAFRANEQIYALSHGTPEAGGGVRYHLPVLEMIGYSGNGDTPQTSEVSNG